MLITYVEIRRIVFLRIGVIQITIANKITLKTFWRILNAITKQIIKLNVNLKILKNCFLEKL